jgi:hypothetical protein
MSNATLSWSHSRDSNTLLWLWVPAFAGTTKKSPDRDAAADGAVQHLRGLFDAVGG